MKETSKAMRRRWCESNEDIQWRHVFAGNGIDVGSGDDPVPFEGCMSFDKKDGDANCLDLIVGAERFDYLHASQVLEHMVNPVEALKSWIRVVKPGGWIVVTVPDMILYEGMKWPSRWNSDHKSTWSLYYKNSPCDNHVYVPDMLVKLGSLADVKLSRMVDANYNYKIGTSIDQTLDESSGVECWIEIVLCKKRTSNLLLSEPIRKASLSSILFGTA